MTLGSYCVAGPEANYFVLSLAFLRPFIVHSIFDQASLWPLSKWVYLTSVDHQLLQAQRLRTSSYNTETYSRDPPAWKPSACLVFTPMCFKCAWIHDSLCSATVKMSWDCHHAGAWYFRCPESEILSHGHTIFVFQHKLSSLIPTAEKFVFSHWYLPFFFHVLTHTKVNTHFC